MKIKLDENLPCRLVNLLIELGHETDTVPEEGLAGHNDSEIWEVVQKEGYFFITQDLDFSDTRRFIPGTHNGLLLMRLRDPGREALLQRIKYLFKTESVADWKGCFVLVTEHKIRVKYPAS